MKFWPRTALCVGGAFVAGIGGALVGREAFPVNRPSHELHEVIHHRLHLDKDQRGRLEALETIFATRRRALELEIQADNAQLAEAIETEHGEGPEVTAAVERTHAAMGELGKVTLEHVFAMRRILKPDQQTRFDRAVAEALNGERK